MQHIWILLFALFIGGFALAILALNKARPKLFALALMAVLIGSAGAQMLQPYWSKETIQVPMSHDPVFNPAHLFETNSTKGKGTL